MTPSPLVSIITPFFNAEPYFEEAIASVIAQTDDNWELMLVDDGSTDGSTAIALHYAAQYPEKIHYLEHQGHQNRGKSTSRNLGIGRAKGEYIALLDADDVYLPEKLERQVATLQAQPESGMVYGPTLYWYGWTGQPQDRKRDRLATLGVEGNSLMEPPHLLTRYLRNAGVVPCTCGLLVRRKLVEAIDGFDETIQHLYEDQVFIAKICLNAPVFIETWCGDKYRQHEASSSMAAIRAGQYHPQKLNPVRLIFLQWLGNYLVEQKNKDAQLWQAYQREIWYYKHPQLAKFLLPVNSSIARVRSAIDAMA